MPNRSRYGATTTTLPDGETFDNDKQHAGNDDIFTIFDGIAWKNEKMRLMQWTSTKDGNGAVRARERKILAFLGEHNLESPEGATIEVLGYGVGSFDYHSVLIGSTFNKQDI